MSEGKSEPKTVPQIEAPKVMTVLYSGSRCLEELIKTMMHEGQTDDAIELGKLWQAHVQIVSAIDDRFQEVFDLE